MNTTPTQVPVSFALRWLSRAGIALAAFLGATLSAQPTGTVTGVVTDRASSGYLVGADVRVAGTTIATPTARDGTFTLSNVPTGPQSLEVSYVGRKTKIVPVNVRTDASTATTIDLAESDVLMLEAVTVESVREGQSRAINQQRTSNTVMS